MPDVRNSGHGAGTARAGIQDHLRNVGVWQIRIMPATGGGLSPQNACKSLRILLFLAGGDYCLRAPEQEITSSVHVSTSNESAEGLSVIPDSRPNEQDLKCPKI